MQNRASAFFTKVKNTYTYLIRRYKIMFGNFYCITNLLICLLFLEKRGIDIDFECFFWYNGVEKEKFLIKYINYNLPNEMNVW